MAGPLHLRIWEHSLAEAPDAWAGPNSRSLSLDDDALERKVAAAAGYIELAREVEGSLKSWGGAAFKVEVLPPVMRPERPKKPPGQPLHYEVFGERRVREGAYPEAICWESHIRPLVESLWDSVT